MCRRPYVRARRSAPRGAPPILELLVHVLHGDAAGSVHAVPAVSVQEDQVNGGSAVDQLVHAEELLDGRPTIHLVFFDRHGWYCVHGPGCVAVTDVRKELKDRERAARR